MRALRGWLLATIIGSLPGLAFADASVLTGDFQGTGRACSGKLSIRADTIEWKSSYSLCAPGEYEIYERSLQDGRERFVFVLKAPGERCRYPIIEAEHHGGDSWEVSGYQSMEGFLNRDVAGWHNSPLPERQVLSCPMIRLD
ncbi:MAG: hypothetical protein ACN6PJ_26930 [Achromobacter sp.]|uniref:hypothetical protein n=1 Tax=Achromobacter sp. TaxID=134375 RepID=UPI003CFC878E